VAVLWREKAPVSVEVLELSEPQRGEVLVRMAAAGVCASDGHVISGATDHPKPCALGHEGAGVVERCGAGVVTVKPGDLVALSWSPSCGACADCMRGLPALCQAYLKPVWAGTMLDGSTRLSGGVVSYCALGCFADRVVVSERSCVAMPPGVPPQVAALIGCAVSTGYGAVVNTAQARPGQCVVVFGAGGVGLSAAMAAASTGCYPVIVVDKVAAKAGVAKDMGATHFVPWNDADPEASLAAIRAHTLDGEGADIAIEAVGNPALQARCLEVVRRAGTAVFVGLSPMGSTTAVPGAALTRSSKRILGSYYGDVVPSRDFPGIARLYLAGKLPLDRLIRRSYRLEEINEAYADLRAGRIIGRAIINLGLPSPKL